MNLGVSLLGVLNTPFWFSLSLIYAIKNWKSARFFGTAIARVGNLLIATAVTMFLFIYLFAIIGFIFLRDRYDMVDGPPACEFFWGCVLFHWTDGLRNEGGVAAMLPLVNPAELMGQHDGSVNPRVLLWFFHDMTYFLLIALVMFG